MKQVFSFPTGSDTELSDRTFHASRATKLMLGLILGAFLLLVATSCLIKVNIYATASGRIEPLGRSKPVQTLTGGSVLAIHASEGQQVRAGQALVELDPAEALTERAAALYAYQALSAEVARRRAEIAGAKQGGSAAAAAPLFPDEVPTEMRGEQLALFRSDMAQLAAELGSNASKRAESLARAAGSERTAARQRQLIQSSTQRLSIRETLTQKGFVSKSSVLDAQEIVQREGGELAQITSAGEEARANAATVLAQGRQMIAQYIADNANGLGVALAKLASARSDLNRADQKLRETTIRAPIDGTLQQFAISSPMQVLSAGQQIATIVPVGGQFRVQALLPNQDAGFVKVGQRALLKFSAYPSTVYGVVPGTVTRISRDAVAGPEAENAYSDKQGRLGPAAAAATTADRADMRFVYPIEVVVRESDAKAFGHDLKPGMSAGVEVVTGSRRLIGLVFAPMVETATAAGHSR